MSPRIYAALIYLVLIFGSVPLAMGQSIPGGETRIDELVQRYLGIYVVQRARRDASETVRFKDGVLSIAFRWSGRAKKRDITCTGGRWLAVGRLRSAEGARALFRRATRLKRIKLTFVSVATNVVPVGDGKYKQERQVSEIARFELSRIKAMNLDPRILRETLAGQRCERFTRSLLDVVRVKAKSAKLR